MLLGLVAFLALQISCVQEMLAALLLFTAVFVVFRPRRARLVSH